VIDSDTVLASSGSDILPGASSLLLSYHKRCTARSLLWPGEDRTFVTL